MKYHIGDLVRTSARNPGGHNRLPRYLRAKQGRIETVHACFPLADERACGRLVSERLYTVAFDAYEVWNRDAEPLCTLHAELWESYLERV